eukprot:4949576-Alexandrium_andersonii.AAC.1
MGLSRHSPIGLGLRAGPRAPSPPLGVPHERRRHCCPCFGHPGRGPRGLLRCPRPAWGIPCT